ncbi:UNVERIFIED_CONTAM: hypothetical protein FKN15_041101 [Acipenser sinensis]
MDARQQESQTKLRRILNTPQVMAASVAKYGKERVGFMVENLKRLSGLGVSLGHAWTFKRMELMIDGFFNLLKTLGDNQGEDFRLEIFQLELLCGFVFGVAPRQLGTDMYRYKHHLLTKLGLSTPEIESYNPEIPSLRVSEKIDSIISKYDKRYTLALVPRRCDSSRNWVLVVPLGGEGRLKIVGFGAELGELSSLYVILRGPDKTPKLWADVGFVVDTGTLTEGGEIRELVHFNVRRHGVEYTERECLPEAKIKSLSYSTGTELATFLQVVYMDRVVRLPERLVRAKEIETWVYNRLLSHYRVDIAYHFMLYRRVVEKHFGGNVPVDRDAVEQCLEVEVSSLRGEAGLPLDAHGDSANWSSVERPTAGEAMFEAARDLVSCAEEARSPAMDIWKALESLNHHPGLYRCVADDPRYFIPIDPWRCDYRSLLAAGETVFDLLVHYVSVNPEEDGSALSRYKSMGLPDRRAWGTVAPVLLMDDSRKSEKHFSYVVADAPSVFERWKTSPPGSCCWNEVFVESRPVYTLNVDIDMALGEGYRCDPNHLGMVAGDFLLCLKRAVASFFNLRHSDDRKYGPFAVYQRKKALPAKYSLRVVWKPPLEACFQNICSAKAFVAQLKRESLSTKTLRQRVLMTEERDRIFTNPFEGDVWMLETSPKTTSRLIRADGSVVSLPQGSFLSQRLLNDVCRGSLVSVIDAEPYAARKSVRLPLCDKPDGGGRFEYQGSWNILLQDSDTHELYRDGSPTYGLSALPLTLTRTVLSKRPHVLKHSDVVPAAHCATRSSASDPAPPSTERVAEALKKINCTYGRDCFFLKSEIDGSALLVSKETGLHCMVHSKTHRNATPYFSVTVRHIYPKCFAPKADDGCYLVAEWNAEDKKLYPVKKTGDPSGDGF